MKPQEYHQNREMLYRTASISLPNFPKRSTDFYLAILPHKKSVRRGVWKDLLWLRVRGKHTIAQVKKFYTKSTGSKVIFMDGGSVVEDNAEIRSLSYNNTDMVALWTVSTEREPLGVASSIRHNTQPVKEESHAKQSWETRFMGTSQDLPPQRSSGPGMFTSIVQRVRGILSSSPDRKAVFKTPTMDSSSPVSVSGLMSGFVNDSTGGETDTEFVIPQAQLKRKRSSEDSGEDIAKIPTYTSPDERRLRASFPDSHFEWIKTANTSVFRCLDCDRDFPSCALTHLYTHLASKRHELKVIKAKKQRVS